VIKSAVNILETEINIAGSGASFECWYHGREGRCSLRST
jgi:hypothetical protein